MTTLWQVFANAFLFKKFQMDVWLILGTAFKKAQDIEAFYKAAANTVNGERFVGLNFCGFCDYEEDRESLSVNILHEL